jgi:Ca2+-binding EF-hand superfamily protein
MNLRISSSTVLLFTVTGALLLPAQTTPGSGASSLPATPAETRPAEPGRNQPDAGAKTPQATAEDGFARMDTDGDGRVSAGEYVASDQAAVDRIAEGKRIGPAGENGRPERSRFFRQQDADGDGYLSRGELRMPAGTGGYVEGDEH